MVGSVCSPSLEVTFLFMGTLKLSGLWSFYGKLHSKTFFITDNLLYLLILQKFRGLWLEPHIAENCGICKKYP